MSENLTSSALDKLGFSKPCVNSGRNLMIENKNIGTIYYPIKDGNAYSFGWYGKKGWVWHDVNTVEQLNSLIEKAKREYTE